MPPRYAILFKTYTWTEFTARQLARLQARTRQGDVFVVVDNTSGRVPEIPHDRVVRLTEQDTVDLGLAYATTDRSLFWYNPDYLHYGFFAAHGDYDYYVAIEDDACLQLDLDALMDDLAARQIDLLASRVKHPSAWAWTEFHKLVYTPDEMRLGLLCFSAYSRRAMAKLFERRLDMARAFETGHLRFWPISEAFVPTEIHLAGYRTAYLEEYGSTEAYDWWPPSHEADLELHPDKTFVHPVLEGARYLRSVLKHERNLLSYLKPQSGIRRTLSRFPKPIADQAFRDELRARTMRYLRRRLERLGPQRHWAAGAFHNGKVVQGPVASEAAPAKPANAGSLASGA
jgi:hypothetical protein